MSMSCCSAATQGEGSEHHCPVEATLGLVGGKYKALILWKLIPAPMRFSELRRAVPGATPKMLTQQLRELKRTQAPEAEDKIINKRTRELLRQWVNRGRIIPIEGNSNMWQQV